MNKDKEIIIAGFARNKRSIIKLLSLLLLIFLIYIFENYNFYPIIIQKKYAIAFLKNFLLNYLNNNNDKQSYAPHIIYNNSVPNITVVIPLYNSQNSIKMSIRSIQIQNFKNIEMILVNDNSRDETLNIINRMKNNDTRIKIINNRKNMGILYSRSIGALNAKGKYIFCLDNDDLFYDEDLFNTIYKISESEDYDIVEFKSFYVKKYSQKLKLGEIKDSPFNRHPNNYTLTQPKLGLFPISRKNHYFSNDYHLWGKSIKSKIYKKAINSLGEIKFSFYNCWTEDISILFIIFSIAQTFIFVNVYGIIHIDYKKSTTYTLPYSKKLMSELFLLDILLEFINDREANKLYLVEKLSSILKTYISHINNEHKKYFNLLINKILKIKTLSKDDKEIINNYFKVINK